MMSAISMSSRHRQEIQAQPRFSEEIIVLQLVLLCEFGDISAFSFTSSFKIDQLSIFKAYAAS